MKFNKYTHTVTYTHTMCRNKIESNNSRACKEELPRNTRRIFTNLRSESTTTANI